VKIITDNISKNLMRHGIAVSAGCRTEFWAASQWTIWPLGFQPQRTLDAAVSRDCRLEPWENTDTKDRRSSRSCSTPARCGSIARGRVSRRPAEIFSASLGEAAKRQPTSLIVEDKKNYRSSQRAYKQTHVSRSQRCPCPADAETGGATTAGVDRDAAGLRQRWSARLHQYGAWCKEKADGVRPNRH
jgi:hypothetical protein